MLIRMLLLHLELGCSGLLVYLIVELLEKQLLLRLHCSSLHWLLSLLLLLLVENGHELSMLLEIHTSWIVLLSGLVHLSCEGAALFLQRWVLRELRLLLLLRLRLLVIDPILVEIYWLSTLILLLLGEQ